MGDLPGMYHRLVPRSRFMESTRFQRCGSVRVEVSIQPALVAPESCTCLSLISCKRPYRTWHLCCNRSRRLAISAKLTHQGPGRSGPAGACHGLEGTLHGGASGGQCSHHDALPLFYDTCQHSPAQPGTTCSILYVIEYLSLGLVGQSSSLGDVLYKWKRRRA